MILKEGKKKNSIFKKKKIFSNNSKNITTFVFLERGMQMDAII